MALLALSRLCPCTIRRLTCSGTACVLSRYLTQAVIRTGKTLSSPEFDGKSKRNASFRSSNNGTKSFGTQTDGTSGGNISSAAHHVGDATKKRNSTESVPSYPSAVASSPSSSSNPSKPQLRLELEQVIGPLGAGCTSGKLDHQITGCLRVSMEPDGILLITLSRPNKKNAITRTMSLQLDALVWHMRNLQPKERDRLRAIVITGDPSSDAFAAGTDTNTLRQQAAENPLTNANFLHYFYDSLLQLLRAPVPIFAAINGIALGSGTGLALACDFRIAAKNTIISFDWPGMHPGMTITHLLPQLLGTPRAQELLLFQDELTGEEAFECGLLYKLVERPADVLTETMAAARAMMRKPGSSTAARRTTLNTLRRNAIARVQSALDHDADIQALCMTHVDFKRLLLARHGRNPLTYTKAVPAAEDEQEQTQREPDQQQRKLKQPQQNFQLKQ